MKRSGSFYSVVLSLGFASSVVYAPFVNATVLAPSIDQVRAQIETNRISKSPVPMKLKDAPYPKYLIYTQIQDIYPALYADEWEKLTTKPPLDLLFNELIKMIVEGKVPDAVKDEVKQIGPRLARNVQKGEGPNCVLDTSEKITKVPTSALIALKADVLNLINNCAYRKRIYNAAKPALIKARKDPAVLKLIKEGAASKFPTEFRAGFQKAIAEKIQNFPELVIQKFGGEMHPIWGEGGSIVEVTNETPLIAGGKQIITLEQFGRGLRADLESAAILMKSTKKKDRGLAAGLFYAAMNRLLMITGGKEITLNSSGLAIGPETPRPSPTGVPTDIPSAVPGPNFGVLLPTPTPVHTGPDAPNLVATVFGGWGVEMIDGKPVMSGWDWEGYDPDADKNPTPYRLMPARFAVGVNGIATIIDEKDMVLTNQGIAELLSALATFVEYTAPNSVFGKFFGSKDQVADLLDPAKPLIFPREGRLFALAILNGIAQNLMEANRGHVQMLMDPKDDKSVDLTGQGKGVWPKFRDRSTFTSVESTNIDIYGLSRLLRGAEDLRLALLNDTDLKVLEPTLESVAVQVQSLVQFGVLEIGYKSQMPDGSFKRYIYGSEETKGDLLATIEVLQTFVKMYNSTDGAELFYLRIPDAWKALAAMLPGAKLDSYAKERLHLLWDQTQILLPQKHPELEIPAWETAVRGVIPL